jgi:hypothetical protein
MLTASTYSVTPTGVLHNMSAPPRTSFDSRVSAVTGSFFVFQLTPPAKPLTKRNLARPIFDCGLENIPPREQVEAAARNMPAFLIGVRSHSTDNSKYYALTDTVFSIAVLSRRVGEIYVRSRQPDYSAGHLLNQKPFTAEVWEGAL